MSIFNDVFKTSVGKTVILVFDTKKASFPHEYRVGVIENLNSVKVYLNVEGCLEIYTLDLIESMYQKDVK